MLAATGGERELCVSGPTRKALESILGEDVSDTTLYAYLDKAAADSVSLKVIPIQISLLSDILLIR